MAKLTAAQRKKIPPSKFGLPEVKGKGGKNEAGKGGYPVPALSCHDGYLLRERPGAGCGSCRD